MHLASTVGIRCSENKSNKSNDVKWMRRRVVVIREVLLGDR